MKLPRDENLTFSLEAHESFEALLGQGGGTPIGLPEVCEYALSRGRVLLQGAPGSGKTAFASRILKEATVRVLLLDGRDYVATVGSPVEATFWVIDQVVQSEPGFIAIVDGLDLCSDDQVQWLLDAVDDYARSEPRVGFLVLDRIARRDVPLNRWGLISLNGVSGTNSDSGSERWRTFAFYRHLSRFADSGNSPAEVLLAYTSQCLAAADFSLSEMAELQYRHRILPDEAPAGIETVPAVNSRVEKALLDADLVVRPPESPELLWRHALIARYFESVYLASRPELWTSEIFRTLTFEGAQIEILDLTLEQVDRTRVNDFVKAVDNWSYSASGRLLAFDVQSSGRISNDLRLAVLLLLGKRRFSSVPSTKRQAEDLLRGHGGPIAQRILSVGDLSGLHAIASVGPAKVTDWWDQWQELFKTPATLAQERQRVEWLGASDGVLGWTAANSLCERALSAATRRSLIELSTQSHDDVERWRAIHALGGSPFDDVWRHALDVFDKDQSRWVRYGALRTAMIVTAHLPRASARREAIDGLIERASVFPTQDRWVDLLEATLLVEDTPSEWLNEVGPFIEMLWANSPSISGQDRWRMVSRTLRNRSKSGLVGK